MQEQAAAEPKLEGMFLRQLVPMAHVADVAQSIEFYKQLGFEVKNTVEHDGQLQWAWLQNGQADFMIARSARPMNPDAQDVLFYLYSPDVVTYRNELQSRGVKVGQLNYPFYSPRGEFRVDDPDGYALFVSHADNS
jgi:catechol 2,3-dioxygenase-like lactoylglutathione lyase family enzyme